MTSVIDEAKKVRRWRVSGEHRAENGNGGAGGAAAPVSREMVAAVVPEHLLQQDEVVLILTKPSLWFIILTSFRFILTTVLLGVLAVQLLQLDSASTLTPQTIGFLTVIVAMGRLIWALLVWTSHIYMLTNQRVVTIKGVINVHVFQAPLRKVQRTALYKPLIMRIFGVGTVGFATAATTDFDSTWVMVGRPLETHDQIVGAINRVG